MAFFLGIDGGGTKTECVLADEAGEVLSRAGGAGSHLRRVSAGELESVLKDCLAQLRETTRISSPTFAAVGAGFAGASDGEARARAERVLREVLRPQALYLVGDMEVALEAAVGAGAGVVLVAGTGSIAYGRDERGREARAGGHGPEAGDEGSGYDIGRRALEAAREAAEDSGEETLLREAVFATLGIESDEELEAWKAPERAAELAGLLPLVTRAARRGDLVAAAILQQAGAALARLAIEVLERLGLRESEARVALSGGVFADSPEVFARVEGELLAAAPHVQVELLAASPAEGAARLAQRRWLEHQGRAAGREG